MLFVSGGAVNTTSGVAEGMGWVSWRLFHVLFTILHRLLFRQERNSSPSREKKTVNSRQYIPFIFPLPFCPLLEKIKTRVGRSHRFSFGGRACETLTGSSARAEKLRLAREVKVYIQTIDGR